VLRSRRHWGGRLSELGPVLLNGLALQNCYCNNASTVMLQIFLGTVDNPGESSHVCFKISGPNPRLLVLEHHPKVYCRGTSALYGQVQAGEKLW
jgi:hypothetical protein